MALRRHLDVAVAVLFASRLARGEVFELSGTSFPNNGQARMAFVTTVSLGDRVTLEGVVLEGPSNTSPQGLGIAMMPTLGPWPALICGADRVELANLTNPPGAVLVQLGAGIVGTGAAELGVAGPWSVVVANCAGSQDVIIAGGTVSVKSEHGFLAAHEQATISVQVGFAVVYIVLACSWAWFNHRRAGGWAQTTLASRVITSLIIVCAATTLATLCGLFAKQQMSFFIAVDVCIVAQALRFGQVLFAFLGLACGASSFGIRPAGVAQEVAASVMTASLVPPLHSLRRNTADAGDGQGLSVLTPLPAIVMLAATTAWVLWQMARRMRELRGESVVEEQAFANGSLLRLRVTCVLFLTVVLCAILAMWAMMTMLHVSYRDFVLAEQAATFVVLTFLMAIWAFEFDGERGYATMKMESSANDLGGQRESTVNDLGDAESAPAILPSPVAVGAPTNDSVEGDALCVEPKLVSGNPTV